MRLFFCLIALFITCHLQADCPPNKETPPKKQAVSFIGKPKYDPARTCHLDGANPDAPKRGVLRQGIVGNFDNLNGFNSVGNPAQGLSMISPPLVYERLMRRSPDEVFTLYGLLADSVQMAPDHSWMIIHLNPKATWADGKPVTSEDIDFTHKMLKEKGRGPLKLMNGKVKETEIISKRSIKFTFNAIEGDTYSRELPYNIAAMVVLPKHFFKKTDFDKPILEVGPGSGPYKILTVDMGRKISFARRPDYWAKDHFLNKGLYNFDEIHYLYYLNASVAEEAFKAGDYDFQILQTPQQFKALDCAALHDGRMTKKELSHKNAVGIQGFIMNTRQEIFKDRRVRNAILLALSNKKEINDKHYYGHLQVTKSYFENTDFAAGDELSAEEEKALKAGNFSTDEMDILKGGIQPPLANDAKKHRENLMKASVLLKEAGWHMEKGELKNAEKQPFQFDILVFEEEHGKLALVVKDALKALGVQVDIRQTDNASYWKRVMDYDFESTFFTYGGTQAPGTEQQYRWHSNGVTQKGTINFPGAHNPLIDKIVMWIPTLSDFETYVGSVRLLDRALKSEKYVVHLFHSSVNRVAIWNYVRLPEHNPKIALSTAAWWDGREQNR